MATAESHFALRNSRVLIASSNQEFRRQWIGNPQFDAANIEEAAGGADALAKLESQHWNEILLDRRLHDLDVGEVISIIRTRHPHLLVRLVDSDLNLEGSNDCPATFDETAVAAAEPLAGDANVSRKALFDGEIGLVEEREIETARH